MRQLGVHRVAVGRSTGALVPILWAVAAILFIFCICISPARAEPFLKGVDYTLIENAPRARSSGPVEVIDVFSYICPHCAEFHPLMKSWEAAIDRSRVRLIHVPVMFGMQPPWQLLARGYFAAEALGTQPTVHHDVFDVLWKSSRGTSHVPAPRSLEDVADIYQRLGVDRSAFIRAASSEMTESRLRETANLMDALQVTGTPEIIVDRRYRVIPGRDVPLGKVLLIVDYLITKEQK